MAELKGAEFAGKWVLERSENFEDFLSEMGVNWMVRKMANMSKPTSVYKVSGDDFLIQTTTAMGTREEKFTIGQEFEQLAHGKKAKGVPSWDGDKLVVKVEPLDDDVKPHSYTREIVNGELLTTINIGDVVCKRYYTKLESGV